MNNTVRSMLISAVLLGAFHTPVWAQSPGPMVPRPGDTRTETIDPSETDKVQTLRFTGQAPRSAAGTSTSSFALPAGDMGASPISPGARDIKADPAAPAALPASAAEIEPAALPLQAPAALDIKNHGDTTLSSHPSRDVKTSTTTPPVMLIRDPESGTAAGTPAVGTGAGTMTGTTRTTPARTTTTTSAGRTTPTATGMEAWGRRDAVWPASGATGPGRTSPSVNSRVVRTTSPDNGQRTDPAAVAPQQDVYMQTIEEDNIRTGTTPGDTRITTPSGPRDASRSTPMTPSFTESRSTRSTGAQENIRIGPTPRESWPTRGFVMPRGTGLDPHPLR